MTSVVLHEEREQRNAAEVHLYRLGAARLCLHEYSLMTDLCVSLLPLCSVVTSSHAVLTVNTRLRLHVESQTFHVNILTASNIKVAFVLSGSIQKQKPRLCSPCQINDLTSQGLNATDPRSVALRTAVQCIS